MYHPVGENMPQNLPHILRMAECIKEQNYLKMILVARGSSGAIIAGIISSIFGGCPINYVRKEIECEHSGGYYNYEPGVPIVVVDDFMVTGNTINAIISHLNDCGVHKADLLITSGSDHRAYKFDDFFTKQIHLKL